MRAQLLFLADEGNILFKKKKKSDIHVEFMQLGYSFRKKQRREDASQSNGLQRYPI